MVASSYALNHERAFERFEADFLSQDFQSALIGRVLAPSNWARLASPRFGRGDLFVADVQFHLNEVTLQGAADPVLRERLLAIPTTLGLPAADVAALRDYAKQALRDSPDYRRLLEALCR